MRHKTFFLASFSCSSGIFIFHFIFLNQTACKRTGQTAGRTRTLGHADLLPVLALELVLLEGALPLLDVGLLLVLVQVQDEEAELALKHVLLPLGQLLLALPQELLVGLLLQRRLLQLLLAASQLLAGGGRR